MKQWNKNHKNTDVILQAAKQSPLMSVGEQEIEMQHHFVSPKTENVIHY